MFEIVRDIFLCIKFESFIFVLYFEKVFIKFLIPWLEKPWVHLDIYANAKSTAVVFSYDYELKSFAM